MTLNIGVVGTGADPDKPGPEGYAMAYKHAAGYERLDDCRLAACSDIVPKNARAFADRFGVGGVYEEYETMLAEEGLDVVSVCVPPAVYADVATGCARHSDLSAIHCEKPMAHTWGDCERMVEVCDTEGVRLTINHQRRLGPTYRTAKTPLDDGKIGSLRRVEIATGDLYDTGTHLFDLCGFFTGQTPVEWVFAGTDYCEENLWFGAHNENQALSQWRYEDGVYGLASTGWGDDAVGCYVRLVGDDGRIEIGAEDGPPLRIRHGRTLGWRTVDTGEKIWGDHQPGYLKAGFAKVAPGLPGVPDDPLDYPSHIDRTIEAVVWAVQEDGECELKAENALEAAGLAFASWESVRRRGRIDLPLDVEDNPLESMVESGVLGLERSEDAHVASSADDG